MKDQASKSSITHPKINSGPIWSSSERVPFFQADKRPVIQTTVDPFFNSQPQNPFFKKSNTFARERTIQTKGIPATATEYSPTPQYENKTGLPDDLRDGVESLSGLEMSDVKVHYRSAEPKGINALAFAKGTDIHLAPGQEKHLPHEAWHVAQQKQGRVHPPTQTKGSPPINDDQGLEKEADIMGMKATKMCGFNESREGYKNKPIHAPVVQRAMGMEVELGRGLSSANGRKLAGDEHVIEQPYFNLVTDSRGAISNIEFVMHHFDQHEGEEDGALGRLNERLAAMKALFDLISADQDGGVRLSAIANGYNYAATPIPNKIRDDETTAPDHVVLLPPGPGAHDLYVQYTIGIDLTKIHRATGDIEQTSYNHNRQTGKEHATDALAFANELMGNGLAGIDDEQAVKGFLTLIYMQIAAFSDNIQANINKEHGDPFPTQEAIDRSPGQIKNKTILLSRVTLHNAFAALGETAKNTIQANQEDILNAMATKMEGRGMAFAENATRNVPNREEVSLIAYARSALNRGANDVSQEQVFGKVHQTAVDQTVPGRRGIPLELRSYNAVQINWPTMEADARRLLAQSRNLHQ